MTILSEVNPIPQLSPELIKSLPKAAQTSRFLLYGEDEPVIAPKYKKQEVISPAQIESINRGDILYEDDETGVK